MIVTTTTTGSHASLFACISCRIVAGNIIMVVHQLKDRACISSKVIAACVLWCDIFASITNGCKSWLRRVWWCVQGSGWASHCKTLKCQQGHLLKEEERGWVRKADLDLEYTGFSLFHCVGSWPHPRVSFPLLILSFSHPHGIGSFPSLLQGQRGVALYTKKWGIQEKIILLQCIDWRKYFHSKFKSYTNSCRIEDQKAICSLSAWRVVWILILNKTDLYCM